jgi:hypothetical protein
MTRQQQNPPQKYTPDRKVVVWTWVKRQIEKSGPSRNGADACKLIDQQIRTATDEGGRQ